MEALKKYLRIILNIIIPLTTIGLVCILGPVLLKFFLPFVIGWIIAMIANPLVRLFEKKLKIVRKHGSMIIVVVVLGTITGLIYLIVSKLITEAIGFSKDLPVIYDIINTEVRELLGKFEKVLILFPASVQEFLNQFSDNFGGYISMLVQKTASPTVEVAGNVAKGIPKIIVGSIVTILSAYFFIADQDKIVGYLCVHMPESLLRYMVFLKAQFKHLIGGYFLAQFRIMFVVAVILEAGFLILGIKYSFLLAVLIAVLDFLPLFGTGTALFPWALVCLLSGEYPLAAGLVLLYVLTQVVRQIIQPKIVGDSLGLPPMITLLFLYLGFKAKGIAGMILAVPVGLLVINLWKFGVFNGLINNIKLLIQEINKFRKKE